MTQAEFNRLVALDIQRLVAKAQAEYEAAPFNYDGAEIDALRERQLKLSKETA